MDKLILTGIEFYAFGGVGEAEREIGHRYQADVELEVDLAGAAESDLIQHGVDFAEVHRIVVDAGRGQPFRLLESLTGHIAERLLSTFKVERVTVRVAKLLPPIDGIVAAEAVEMTRPRS